MAIASTTLAGLNVTRLGFGTLSISPLQNSVSSESGAELLCYAWHKGIRFWDTAELYENYPVLRRALERLPARPVIATKTYAWTAAQAQRSFQDACRQLGVDSIDIMLLHEQSAHTLPGHMEALEWLVDARGRGLVGAVGVSTHSVACVQAAARLPQVEVIHPIYNQQGIGIVDGSAADMARELEAAHKQGIGIYGMKVLGGGTLYRQPRQALEHGFSRPWMDSVVVGMATRAEVDYNSAVAAGRDVTRQLADAVVARPRRLQVATWCQGCGNCLPACPQQALGVVGPRVEVDSEKCILCGYCSRSCQHMCLKII